MWGPDAASQWAFGAHTRNQVERVLNARLSLVALPLVDTGGRQSPLARADGRFSFPVWRPSAPASPER